MMIQDGIVGASAPAEHVVRGLSGWRWQPLLATKRVAAIVAEALFTTLLWRASFPLMPSTEAQAAEQAREAVLTYIRATPSCVPPSPVGPFTPVLGLTF